MSRLFISHSSVDNAEAVGLRDWLQSEGWDDVFLDIDPLRGIAAGERWERALNQAARRCEAVIFLISHAWLAAPWCRRELDLARRLNKRLFGLLIEEIPLADLPGDLADVWQLEHLASGTDHRMFRVVLKGGKETHVTFSASALASLKAGLTKAGLDARFFGWPPETEPDRPLYRGLRPLEAEDAGVFFGRAAEIVVTLDRLRGLTQNSTAAAFDSVGRVGSRQVVVLTRGPVAATKPQRSRILAVAGHPTGSRGTFW